MSKLSLLISGTAGSLLVNRMINHISEEDSKSTGSSALYGFEIGADVGW